MRVFDETYRPPRHRHVLEHVLRAVQPDVLHVHNLLNLSFDLPAMAHASGAMVVATLHDYTLVCASGGQRIHQAEQHVCDVIDTERCARCFRQSRSIRRCRSAASCHGGARRARQAGRECRAALPAARAARRGRSGSPRDRARA